METCDTARPAPFRCPTGGEVLNAILALLPQGRAWQTIEGGPRDGMVRAFDELSFDNDAFATAEKPSSVLMMFWRSIAEVVTFINFRLCALRLEFWCATQTETHDLWMQEYGLPDECDPFPDLCTKVAALGGTRCEYYTAVAARAGWDIECLEVQSKCGAIVGCGRVGNALRPGGSQAGYLMIRVYLPTSPAYSGGFHQSPRAGRFRVGRPLLCGPSIAGLECLMARMVHAEIKILYEVAQ